MLSNYNNFRFAGGYTSKCVFYYRSSDGDVRRNVQNAFSQLTVRDGVPSSIVELTDVILARRPNHDSLYTHSGNRIPESALLRKQQDGTEYYFNANEDIEIDVAPHKIVQDVIFCGVLFNHWGHFLIESIARLWILSSNPKYKTFCCVYSWLNEKKLFHDNIVEFLNASNVHFIELQKWPEVVSIGRCIVTEPTFSELNYCYTGHSNITRYAATKILSATGNIRNLSDSPCYLSRSRLDSRQPRTLVNEEDLEDSLRRHKIEIIYPEALTLNEQVELFNTRRVVIGCWGSAMHSSLLCISPEKLRTFTISEYGVPRNCVLSDAAVGHTSIYISALRPVGGIEVPKGGTNVLFIDIPAVMECLRIEGVI